MKSPWPVVLVVASISLLWMAQAKPDEPGKTQMPAADPMRGKEPGQVRDDNGLKMKLVWCPPGIFTMEYVELITKPAAEKEDKANDDLVDDPSEEPKPRQTTKITPVKVFLTKGYWLGKYEVTQSEWKQVMQTEPWKGQEFTKVGDDFPATGISWHDATAFGRRLSKQERNAGRLPEGWEYTLPTEAQWERACRARTETKYSFGDDDSQLPEYAWFDSNAVNIGEDFAHRVGQKKSNAWGLHDMHGNVWEWCRDFYVERMPGGRDPDMKSNEKTKDSGRVLRGGCWRYYGGLCRSAYRHGYSSEIRHPCLGFRLVLNPVQ